MRALILCTTVAALAGCSLAAVNITPNSVITAQPYVGLQERLDRGELRDLVGVDPVRIEWCAAFVNAILDKDGIPGSDSVSNYPLTARSFLQWGEPVAEQDIQRGDIVVFPRGNSSWQGHVGFFVNSQTVDGQQLWIILGGNQSNSVRYDLYDPNRAIGIRRWPVQIEMLEEQLLDQSIASTENTSPGD